MDIGNVVWQDHQNEGQWSQPYQEEQWQTDQWTAISPDGRPVAEISVEEKISAFDEWAAAGFGDMDINGIQDHPNSICYTCSQKGHISPQCPNGKGK